MQKTILEANIEKALEGSKKIVITIKQDSVDYITSLWAMNEYGRISLEDKDILTTVGNKSYHWGKEQNRSFTVTLTKKFNKDLFIEQMYPGIDKIEAVN